MRSEQAQTSLDVASTVASAEALEKRMADSSEAFQPLSAALSRLHDQALREAITRRRCRGPLPSASADFSP
eukprot:scaffold4855_cov261-Pinguiococcus_pyrenoidosus.AAC.4